MLVRYGWKIGISLLPQSLQCPRRAGCAHSKAEGSASFFSAQPGRCLGDEKANFFTKTIIYLEVRGRHGILCIAVRGTEVHGC